MLVLAPQTQRITTSSMLPHCLAPICSRWKVGAGPCHAVASRAMPWHKKRVKPCHNCSCHAMSNCVFFVNRGAFGKQSSGNYKGTATEFRRARRAGQKSEVFLKICSFLENHKENANKSRRAKRAGQKVWGVFSNFMLNDKENANEFWRAKRAGNFLKCFIIF